MNSKQKQRKKDDLILQHGSYCCWCGKFFPKNDLTIEHIKPKSLGGSNAPENLALACSPCNRLRGNSLLPPPSFPPKKMLKVSFWLVALFFYYRLQNNRTFFEALTKRDF